MENFDITGDFRHSAGKLTATAGLLFPTTNQIGYLCPMSNNNHIPQDPARNLHSKPDAAPPNSPDLDQHGHNPDDYDWVPVRRKRRKDGWSPEKQRAFIGALADSGVVAEAARSVGMSDAAAYKLRRAPGAEAFAAAWDAALEAASRRLVDIAFDRAINGVDDVVLDREGNHVYTKRKYNDRLLMFLIRAHAPDRYRHANKDVRSADEVALPEQPRPVKSAVAEAIKLLGPEPPAAPQTRLSPEQLDDALEIADIMDGELPHWQRQDAVGDDEGEAQARKLSDPDISGSQISDNIDRNGKQK